MGRVLTVRALAVAATVATAASLAIAAPVAGDTRGAPILCGGEEVEIIGSGLILGTPGDDVIRGSLADDTIRGGGGNDIICGQGGRDWIRGGLGNDRIFAGAGADRVNSGDGDDIERGGPGWDNCLESGGLDTRIRCEARVVAIPDGPLVGIPLGLFAGQAMGALAEVVDSPRSDTGWIVGCPLDGDAVNERTQRWGGLAAHFYGEGASRELMSWSYNVNGPAGGPRPGQVGLPGGVRFGDPIDEVAADIGSPLQDTIFGFLVDLGGMVLYGGDVATSPLRAVGVPFIPICD